MSKFLMNWNSFFVATSEQILWGGWYNIEIIRNSDQTGLVLTSRDVLFHSFDFITIRNGFTFG